MTIARAHLVDPSVTRWYHCVTRCVRRAFLLGEGMHDPGFTHHNRIFWKSGRTLRLRLVQYSRAGVKDGQFDFLG